MPALLLASKEQFFSPKGSEALIIIKALEKTNFITYISSNESDSQNIAEAIKFFDPTVKIIILPEWDTLPYDRVSPSVSTQLRRISALYELLNLKNQKAVLFASPNCLFQQILPKEQLAKYMFKFTIRQNISRDQLLQSLTAIGYVRSATANNEGEFAVRGGILDIVATGNNLGYRFNFFGNELDEIKCFDTETQISSTKLSECTLLPSSEVILDSSTITRFQENYRKLFSIINDPLLEAVGAGTRYAGLENWLPLFYETLHTIFDYLPDSSAILFHDDFSIKLMEAYALVGEYYSTRLKLSNDANYRPIAPSLLYITPEQVIERLYNFYAIAISSFKSDGSLNLFSPVKNLHLESKTLNLPVFNLLKDYVSTLRQEAINEKTQQKKFIIACFTQGSRDRLKIMLTDHDFHIINVQTWQTRNDVSGKTLGLAILPIEHGFIFENYVILSEQDILGDRLSRAAKRRKHAAKFLQEVSNFTEGEYIVHIDHGIGKFIGLETLKVGSIIHDFIKIIYRDGDKLYVPVENLELLTKYGGDDLAVELDKLGSVAWQTKKAKLQKKLQIAAEELLKIAAQRELAQGVLIEPIKEVYEKFCQKFPYVETEDQLNAITDVEQDLLHGRPMDRLICGDVGFGKTEVALRAVCSVVANPMPYQVAIVVPTTLLSRQHYKNFSERFDNLPVKVAQLSRFVSRRESEDIKKDITEGKVDIVIGTHALLADDIKFKNLGLIVIDEEQHFGVAQKEKLKKLRSNTHILTLSATPIPRTLQMSLTGIKDLSLIATPPIDRLPIKTYVMPYDAFIIREAILREHARGGRTFYVTPRISYLDEIEKRLKESVPEIKAVRAHGQMIASKLDKIMTDFYDGFFDVLLSTTIIESGLDIPFANTIIVDRADMFGLAQLYQIRGRVGRSNTKAYAYLITNQGTKLNPLAQRRLEIIQSLETLGTGFTIASHDLDIRGYGNLVGEEQSGHIKEVGIELYQEMLADSIQRIKLHKDPNEDTASWSPIISIGVSVQIPENYISDDSLRLSIYRKIAQIADLSELESFAAELIDRFGKLPAEAEHLFAVVKLKQIAKNLNIEKIDCGEKAVVFSFKNQKPLNLEKFLAFISCNPGQAKLRPDGKLLITREFKNEENRIKGIEKILASL